MKITKELFRWQRSENEAEAPPPVSAYGYFGDAWRRFLAQGTSRASLAVIALIALFSFLVPVFVKRSDTAMDPYYAKLPPRISVGGASLVRGEVRRRLGDEGLSRLIGIGIGAGEEYSPIIEIGEADGATRPVRLDGYLEVGFVYKSLTEEEYERMSAWERETGRKIFYPLIADNEFNPDPGDANMWYKARGGLALAEVGGECVGVPPGPDMKMLDNYMRGEGGEPIYAIPFGGGSGSARAVRTRVLYHNYYLYQNGTEPSYLLGTDSQGYDLALRTAGGIRVSLILAIGVSFINLVIGALVGAVEGYFGGAVDLILERVTDVLSGVPFVVVATLFQIYLSDRVGAIPSLLFAFVLTGWLGTANRVRGQFFRYKSAEYVLAAKTLGVKDGRIIWRHIFPNTLGTLITASALVIPSVIFTESMLSFLGIVNLGREGVTSLGTLLSDASGIWVNYPHLMIVPAAVISLFMISFNLIGNGLRDAFNPEMKGGV